MPGSPADPPPSSSSRSPQRCCFCCCGLRAATTWAGYSTRHACVRLWDFVVRDPSGNVWVMSRSVLVTGAAGFIGAHVARHCVELGFHVVGLDDLSAGFQGNVPESVEFVHGSINDPLLVARLFEQHR